MRVCILNIYGLFLHKFIHNPHKFWKNYSFFILQEMEGKKWLRLSRIYQVENQWLAILGGYHIVIDLTTAAPSKLLLYHCQELR